MPSTDRRGLATFAVVAAIVIAIGAGLVYYGHGAAQAEEEALENAVEVDVEILDTDIESRERTTTSDDDDFDDDVDDGTRNTETETVYRPTVEFAYEYDGQEYRSSNIYPGGGTFQEYSERSRAEADLDPYDEGSVVTGYVDPNDPGEAFLLREQSGTPQGIQFVGGFFVLFGVVGLLLSRR